MNTIRVWFVLLGVIVIFCCATEILAKDAMQPKTMRILLGNSGKSPYDETAPADVLETFNAAVRGQLLTRNSSFELKPGLLKSWRWNYQNGTYELTLRNDILFHNGRHATAEDLEFAILRGFFSNYRSFYKMYLGNIDGTDEAERHTVFQSGLIKGVKITGKYTLQVKLKTPNPNFLYDLAAAYFSLVPQEALQKNYILWESVPIGAGHYKITSQDTSAGKYVLERVQNNSRTAPLKIEVYTKPNQLLYDIVAFTDPPTAKESYKVQYPKYPDRVWTIFFTNINSLGKNLSFRKAIQYGVNRKALLQGFEPYRPAYELLPSHLWGRADIQDSFNLNKAKELFSSLPKELRDKIWPVPVFGGQTFSSDKKALLEELKRQFAQFGLRVDFYPSQEKFISKKTAMASPMEIAGQVADYVEPVVMFSAFRQDSPFEYEKLNQQDETFERLYALASKAQQSEEKIETVRELSAYFNEIAIAVPLWESKSLYYVNPKTVRSLGDQVEPLYLLVDRVVME